MRGGLSALATYCVLVPLSISSGLCHPQSLVGPRAGPPGEARTKQTAQTLPLSLFGSLPLHFEENKGQAARETRFLARGAGYTLLLERDGLRVDLPQAPGVSMRFVDAQTAAIIGREPSRVKTNYYIGSDPAGWHLNVPSYDSVAYVGFYKGIDLVYHGNGRQLEYDFVVAPHADPGQVRMRFAGQKLEPQGEDLAFEGVDGLRVKALKAYQWVDGNKKIVAASWRIQGDEASILLSSYDHSRELIIDPVFFYGTYIGGEDSDAAVSIVPASEPGYYYVALSTNSRSITEPKPGSSTKNNDPNVRVTLILGIDATNAPPPPSPLPPFCPAAIPPGRSSCDFHPPGLVINSMTYVGGATGTTKPTSMVGSSSNLYITGTTEKGAEFPKLDTQPCSQPQACGGFVAKFATSINTTTSPATATITLKYKFGLPAMPMAIAADDAGNAYLTGAAFKTAGQEKLTIFPVDNAFQNVAAAAIGTGADAHAFLLELDPEGKTLFCSYIGGSGPDQGNAIAVAGDSVFVAGETSSTDFPKTTGLDQAGDKDGFVLGASTLSSSPKLDFSRFLGGAKTDSVASIAIAPSGNLVVTGYTNSSNFPTQPSPKFYALFWPVVNQTDTDFSGNQIQQLPTDPPQIRHLPTAVPDKVQDAFVTSLTADGAHLVFTDFLGGDRPPSSTTGQALAVDSVGVIYVTGSSTVDYVKWVSEPPAPTIPEHFFLSLPPPADDAVKVIGPAIGDIFPGSFDSTDLNPDGTPPKGVFHRIFFSEIDPTGSYLLEATLAGGYGTDQANGLVISGPLEKAGTVSIVGTTFPSPNSTDKSNPNNPNLFLDAATSAVDKVNPAPPDNKHNVKDTTGFFVQEALAGFCSMQRVAQAGTQLTFGGPCVSGTQSGTLYASPASSSSAGTPFSAPIAVTPSGDFLTARVTVDVSAFGNGKANFTFAFFPLGSIGGLGQCNNAGSSLQGCGIVTAGGGAGTIFNVTSGTLTVSLACTGTNCNYNGAANTALVGQPLTLTAAVTNAIPETVTWSSSQGIFDGPNPANSVTFTPTGAGGQVVIQATPVANPSLKPAAITLNTIGAPGGSTSLTILASASKMVAGTTFQFTANQPATWTATAGTIDSSSGQFTAPTSPPVPASVTITATSQSDSSETVSTQVTVFTQPKLVVPSTITLPAGGSVKIPISITAGTGIPGESLLFSCAPSTLPTGVSCAFTPNPFTNAGSEQLVLQMSSSTVGAVTPMRRAPWKGFFLGGSSVIFAALLWMRRRPRWSSRYRFFTAALVLTFLMLMTACGTSGTFATKSGQGHLTGTYTVDINALGATQGAADLGQTVATVSLSVTLQ